MSRTDYGRKPGTASGGGGDIHTPFSMLPKRLQNEYYAERAAEAEARSRQRHVKSQRGAPQRKRTDDQVAYIRWLHGVRKMPVRDISQQTGVPIGEIFNLIKYTTRVHVDPRECPEAFATKPLDLTA